LKISFDCDTEAVELAATNQVPNAMMEIYAASKKLAPSELDIPEKSDKANKPQRAEEVLVKTIDLGTGLDPYPWSMSDFCRDLFTTSCNRQQLSPGCSASTAN
jgi:hypothetical protein